MKRFAVAALMLTACAGDDTTLETPPKSCEDPLAMALPDGSCIRPGIPPDGCAPGFAHDGEYGCAPILPPDPCPSGLMAVPGESECRPVLGCGAGRWGDIPIDATTVYVDQSYAGNDSDGTARRPWTTIQEAVTAASPGSLIAIAEGSYVESVTVLDKPLRLWGVCPEKTVVVAAGPMVCIAAGLCIARASGTEVRGVSITGAGHGIVLSGSENVIVESVHIHDTERMGVHLANDVGPASVTIAASLIEATHEVGVMLAAADAVIERTVVRGTYGIDAKPYCAVVGCEPSGRARATIVGSVVEQNHDQGVSVGGADVEIEASVVRGTLPRALDQQLGRGVDVQMWCDPEGVCDAALRSAATIRGSLIEGNHEVGVRVSGSDATIEATVVRDTLPRAADSGTGRGINVQACLAIGGCSSPARANTTVRHSLVTGNHDIGVIVGGSDLTLEDSVVRDTLARAVDQLSGRGMSIELACVGSAICDPTARASAFVRRSLVAGNREVGIHVSTSDAVLEDSIIRATTARVDGRYGDGASVAGDFGPAGMTVTNVIIEDSARAGLANFGAVAALASMHIRCSSFDLEAEQFGSRPFSFEDRGDNLCGCPSANAPCVAVSADLEPPGPASSP